MLPFAAALIMGAVLIAVLLGFAAMFAMIFAVRAWWFRRKVRPGPPLDGYEPPDTLGAKPAQKRLIEGEYEVVKKPDADDARRPR